MKMILTSATSPDGYIGYLAGWQRDAVVALRALVLRTAPAIDERLKWGHLVYFSNGPAIIVRAEPARVLFGFFRGKRMLHIEPRLSGSGKYELRTLVLKPDTPFTENVAERLVRTAVELNASLGSPHG